METTDRDQDELDRIAALDAAVRRATDDLHAAIREARRPALERGRRPLPWPKIATALRLPRQTIQTRHQEWLDRQETAA